MMHWSHFVVQVCGATVLLTGGMALLGHALAWPLLYAPLPHAIGMAPNTALAFLLTGGALWLLGASPPQPPPKL